MPVSADNADWGADWGAEATPDAMVPLSRPDLSGHEMAYAMAAIGAGEIGPAGPFRDRFEAEWAERNGARHVVSVSSGTAGLHIGLAALGVGPGDEVIVPAMTYVATGNAVLYNGATPVFVDVDAATWCMDPAACEAAVTSRTRAIMPVHLFGQVCAMDALGAIAGRAGAAVVADAAHAPLASYRGRKLGGESMLSVHSFYLNKTLTCGEGGALLVNDDALADIARQLRAHGLDMQVRDRYRRLGFNYRLSNLACAILCSQIERADRIMARSAELDRLYRELLTGVPGVRPQGADRAGDHEAGRAYWMFPVVVEPAFGASRDQVLGRLAARGIQSRPFFAPLHTIGHLAPYRAREPLGHAERLGRDGLMLPLHATMTDAEIRRVVEALDRCRDG